MISGYGRNHMTHLTRWRMATLKQIGFGRAVIMLFYPRAGQSADAPVPAIQMTRQATDPSATQLLTLDDALLIALDNHPNLQAARERIAAQRAVLGQQMAAYYPTISLSNVYETSQTQKAVDPKPTPGSETFTSEAKFNFTL